MNHVEFEGRAKWGKTMPQSELPRGRVYSLSQRTDLSPASPPPDDVDLDGNGHGTHCAGTIASAKYGVAKDANLIAVKVLGSGGSGSMSDVVGGVAWAAQAATIKAQSESAKNGSHKGSVAVGARTGLRLVPQPHADPLLLARATEHVPRRRQVARP